MTLRRVGLLIVLTVTLAAVPAALAAATVLSAKGVISGSGTTWSLEIENTGTELIICFQFFLASGILATTPGTEPAGWQLATNGQVIAGRSEAGIPPGTKQTFTFPTSGPYPPNGGGRLNISSNCHTDVAATVSGPARAAPPPGPRRRSAPAPGSPSQRAPRASASRRGA